METAPCRGKLQQYHNIGVTVTVITSGRMIDGNLKIQIKGDHCILAVMSAFTHPHLSLIYIE